MRTEIYTKIEDLPAGVILPQQVHGERIVEVFTGEEDLEAYDALVTKNKDLSLGIRTADCAPICFSDGEKVGIAHVGWPGLCLGLTEKMLQYFNLSNLDVFIGPFNHKFEIKKDFCYDKISAKFGDRFFQEEDGKIFFLFREAIASLLPNNTTFDPRSTYLDNSLPSFRRDKTTERLITVVSF